MAATAAKKKLKMFHATILVTRLEEWCVEATTPEEARAMLANGVGHRSTVRYLITATGGSIWSNVHCLGALSGRHRISFVP